ncbi:MAG: SRPBCC family protein [Acidobacteria bacterium]|nr:SRPBCC family protein [Acidobacteriota bacterium]
MTAPRESVALGRREGSTTVDAEFFLARSADEVFAFFAEVQNLQAITPAWLDFRIVTSLPIEMRAGAIIDYRLRVRGIPLRWKTEITAWEPPRRFVDVQRRGPYLSWEHEDTFEARDGRTLVRDRVEYRVFGGAWIDRLFVAPDVRRIFIHRNVSSKSHIDENRVR